MSEEKQSDSARRAPPVIDAWDANEPNPDSPCLFANGFTMIDGAPPATEHPYLVLGFPFSLARLGEPYEIALHLAPDSSRCSLYHPENTPNAETLVDVLAEHIASARVTSDVLEVRVNRPLPIYIVDPAWRPAAERFVAEYGRPVNGDLPSK